MFKSPNNPAVQKIRITGARSFELPTIIEVCCAAFTRFEVFGPSWNSDAGILPALLAGQAGNDPQLSRVARSGKAIIGHAQWTECLMNLQGRSHRTAYLAPLSVHPHWQNQGVGGLLMQDGLALLKQRGVSLLFMLGHEAYYPRFGLLGNCHGRNALSQTLPGRIADDPSDWRLRPVACGDELALHQLWKELCGDTDGAMDPGPGIFPWIAKTKGIVACVLEHQGIVRAYARVDLRQEANSEGRLLRFLASDQPAAMLLLSRLAAWGNWPRGAVIVPLPFANPRVKQLFPEGHPVQEYWPAGMAMVLDGDARLHGLLAAIRSAEAPPLFLEWPNLFDW